MARYETVPSGICLQCNAHVGKKKIVRGVLFQLNTDGNNQMYAQSNLLIDTMFCHSEDFARRLEKFLIRR